MRRISPIEASMIAVMMGAVFMAMLVTRSLQSAIVAVMVPMMPLIYRRPVTGIWLMVISMVVVESLAMRGIVPRPLKWVLELSSLTLLLRAITYTFQQGRPLRVFYLIPITVMLVVIFLAQLLVDFQPIIALMGVRRDFLPLLIFITLINLDIPERTYKHLLLVLFLVMIAQTPISIMQALPYGNGGDQCVGTFAPHTTNMYGMLLVAFFGFMYAFYIHFKIKWYWLLMSTLVWISLLLAWSRFSIIAFPLLMAMLFMINSRRSILSSFGVLAIFAGGFYLVIWASSFVLPEGHIHMIKRLDLFIRVHTIEPVTFHPRFGWQTKGGGKFRQMIETVRILPEYNPNALVIGAGIGSGNESFLSNKYDGHFYQRYRDYTFFDNQISWGLVEFGIVGMAAMIAIFLKNLLLLMRLHFRIRDPFWRSMSLGLIGMTVNILGSVIYYPVFFLGYFSVIYWILFSGYYHYVIEPLRQEDPALLSITSRVKNVRLQRPETAPVTG